jgi:hypothetical protein
MRIGTSPEEPHGRLRPLGRDRLAAKELGEDRDRKQFGMDHEGYWLPTKFGYDKRRAHFLSLILTKQMTRDQVSQKVACPANDDETIAQDFEYVATKLDIGVGALPGLMNGPNKTYRDYRNSMPLINAGTQVLRLLGLQKAIIR